MTLFSLHLDASVWFIRESLRVDDMGRCWLRDYLFVCTDPIAREIYAKVLGYAIGRLSCEMHTSRDLDALFQMEENKVLQLAHNNNTALMVGCVLRLTQVTIDMAGSNYIKHAGELFLLLTNLAAYPFVQRLFVERTNIFLLLSFYGMPERLTHASIHGYFAHMAIKISHNRHEFKVLAQPVYEAIAALLGVPQTRKVNLLLDTDAAVNWDQSLTPLAGEALQIIFDEESHQSGGMDLSDITAYFSRVHANRPVTLSAYQLRNVLDCNDKNADGRLNLQGFLTYYRNTAQTNPASVWKVRLCISLWFR
jgi:hypothetical protein